MAGKVFFSVSMSLDGFSAPESMEGILATPERREQDPRVSTVDLFCYGRLCRCECLLWRVRAVA
jgi:hypothetical protein